MCNSCAVVTTFISISNIEQEGDSILLLACGAGQDRIILGGCSGYSVLGVRDGGTASASCFKSSANMAAAILASSSATFLEETSSFVLSLYMHASLLLFSISCRFWCSSTKRMTSDCNRSLHEP